MEGEGEVVVGALAKEGGMRAVLDTSVLIDATKGETGAFHYLDAMAIGDGLYSAVTLCELMAGTPPDGEPALSTFLNRLQICEVTEEIAFRAGQLRRLSKFVLEVPDALIAATALVHHAVLVTRDRDHLSIPDLKVVTP